MNKEKMSRMAEYYEAYRKYIIAYAEALKSLYRDSK